MHCFKSDLLLASEFFQGLLRSPLTETPPVSIKYHQPRIFKRLLRQVPSLFKLFKIKNRVKYLFQIHLHSLSGRTC